jgi:hypothetical protein
VPLHSLNELQNRGSFINNAARGHSYNGSVDGCDGSSKFRNANQENFSKHSFGHCSTKYAKTNRLSGSRGRLVQAQDRSSSKGQFGASLKKLA